jgi:hypothetical protein
MRLHQGRIPATACQLIPLSSTYSMKESDPSRVVSDFKDHHTKQQPKGNTVEMMSGCRGKVDPSSNDDYDEADDKRDCRHDTSGK